MRRRRKLKGTSYVILEDLTKKNAKLQEDASDAPNVTNALSDEGKIIVKLDISEKTEVTLKINKNQ